jgi:DNA-binding MarR family transcriptional regulator
MPELNAMQRLEELQADIVKRMEELRPLVREYELLEEVQSLIEGLAEEREQLMQQLKEAQTPKLTLKERISNWVSEMEDGDTFAPRDLASDLGLTRNAATYWIEKFVEAGKLERFGRGLYRRPLIRRGQARLKVLTR